LVEPWREAGCVGEPAAAALADAARIGKDPE